MVTVVKTAQCTKNPATGVKTVNQYTFQSEAGRGTYSKVKWAQDDDGKRYAIKSFARGVLERRQVAFFDRNGASTQSLKERIDQELRILGLLSHPNVLKLVEIIDDPEHEKLYAVLEGLVGGQLMVWSTPRVAYVVPLREPAVLQKCWGDAVALSQCRPMDEDEDESAPASPIIVYRETIARYLLQQLLEALVYLHQSGVIHKDLKPDNLMLTHPLPCDDPRFVRALDLSDWPSVRDCAQEKILPSEESVTDLLVRVGLRAKVCDFNLAATCQQPDCMIYDAEGTVQFTPPECFDDRPKGIHGKPRDVWSMGCVLFNLLFGRCPYWAEANIVMQMMIMSENFVLPSGVVSNQAEDLLRGLLNRDPSQRLSAEAALQSDWIRGDATCGYRSVDVAAP